MLFCGVGGKRFVVFLSVEVTDFFNEDFDAPSDGNRNDGADKPEHINADSDSRENKKGGEFEAAALDFR